jgi:signal transduction histidine kinase
MAETGAGEIGTLERSFNTMATSLQQSTAELAASRSRVVAAADDARRRIERDLHDGVQQRLVSLGLELRATEAALPPDLDDVKGQLLRTTQGLVGAVVDLQEVSRGIHPAILSKGGLGPAIKTLARRSGLPVELHLQADRRLPEAVEVAAYYVVSEGLTNAAKHAEASAVWVDVDVDERSLRLSVRDDGVGGVDPQRGSGLVGLRDRVDAVGGSMDVTSTAGAGTAIVVTMPLDPDPG